MLRQTQQNQLADYIYIFGTILFTIYGQLVLKWQVSQYGALPSGMTEKAWFIARLLLNPWIISGFASAFLASLCWMAAMTKFELSRAYPFTSLSFVLILFLSAILFRESVTVPKILGMIFIVIGIIIGSQGYR